MNEQKVEQLGTALSELISNTKDAEQHALEQKMVADQQTLDQLGIAIENLPYLPEEPKLPKTFMEIARYKETVFSNILAFYLDTEEEHGLRYLLPKSLLECVDKDMGFDLSNGTIHTEYNAEGKRIDIVAEYDDLVIGIENKLWSAVHNDLEAYSKALNKLAGCPESDEEAKEASYEESRTEDNSTPKEVVKILLAPDKKDDKKLKGGFKSVTYAELFEKVKPKLGEHIHLSNKYITYLVDMFFTLCKPKLEPMKLSEKHQPFIKFLEEHHENFEQAKKMEKELAKDMVKHMQEFHNNNPLEDQPLYEEISKKLGKEGLRLIRWIWENKREDNCCVVYDCCQAENKNYIRNKAQYKGHIIYIDVYKNYSRGWLVLLKKGYDIAKELMHPIKHQETHHTPVKRLVKDGVFDYDKLDEACARAMKVFLDALCILDENA